MSAHEEKDESKRPVDSDFKQQRLPAWQPLLTPKWVIMTFFLVGVCFIPIGILIVTASEDVVELSVRYDERVPNGCNVTLPATCEIPLTLTVEEDMEAPVYVYYELTNYFQNHRRYVKSRSDTQLRGESGSTATCDPLEDNEDGDLLYPCGLIANSYFNDTFLMCSDNTDPSTCSDAGWSSRGIAWQSDIDHKFKYSAALANATGTTTILAGSYDVPLPRPDEEEFMVWMRTAGLPTFRKLHRKIHRSYKKGEIIQIRAANVYPVNSFDGEKRLVLSTTSWLGGKNRFLGWSYVAVAIVCILLSLAFHIKNQTSPRKLGDMQYFSWAGAGAASSDAQ